tara:strand:- start:66 stop:233 length:168 start_codon:yes stop_codon:yes gene_type:complete
MKVYIAYGDGECEGYDFDVVKKIFSTEEKAVAYMTEMNRRKGRRFITCIDIMDVE